MPETDIGRNDPSLGPIGLEIRQESTPGPMDAFLHHSRMNSRYDMDLVKQELVKAIEGWATASDRATRDTVSASRDEIFASIKSTKESIFQEIQRVDILQEIRQQEAEKRLEERLAGLREEIIGARLEATRNHATVTQLFLEMGVAVAENFNSVHADLSQLSGRVETIEDRTKTLLPIEEFFERCRKIKAFLLWWRKQ